MIRAVSQRPGGPWRPSGHDGGTVPRRVGGPTPSGRPYGVRAADKRRGWTNNDWGPRRPGVQSERAAPTASGPPQWRAGELQPAGEVRRAERFHDGREPTESGRRQGIRAAPPEREGSAAVGGFIAFGRPTASDAVPRRPGGHDGSGHGVREVMVSEWSRRPGARRAGRFHDAGGHRVRAVPPLVGRGVGVPGFALPARARWVPIAPVSEGAAESRDCCGDWVRRRLAVRGPPCRMHVIPRHRLLGSWLCWPGWLSVAVHSLALAERWLNGFTAFWPPGALLAGVHQRHRRSVHSAPWAVWGTKRACISTRPCVGQLSVDNAMSTAGWGLCRWPWAAGVAWSCGGGVLLSGGRCTGGLVNPSGVRGVVVSGGGVGGGIRRLRPGPGRRR